jgi:hypothetical protein
MTTQGIAGEYSPTQRFNPEVSLVIAMLIEACMRPRPAWFDTMQEAPGPAIVRKQRTPTRITCDRCGLPTAEPLMRPGNNNLLCCTVDACNVVTQLRTCHNLR